MPFVSEAQRRACWAQYHRDIKKGKKPAWNCPEWQKQTPKSKKLPMYKAKMPNGNLVYQFKQDLGTFSNQDLQKMFEYYSIPPKNKNDRLWLLAYTLARRS